MFETEGVYSSAYYVPGSETVDGKLVFDRLAFYEAQSPEGSIFGIGNIDSDNSRMVLTPNTEAVPKEGEEDVVYMNYGEIDKDTGVPMEGGKARFEADHPSVFEGEWWVDAETPHEAEYTGFWTIRKIYGHVALEGSTQDEEPAF